MISPQTLGPKRNNESQNFSWEEKRKVIKQNPGITDQTLICSYFKVNISYLCTGEEKCHNMKLNQ